MAENGGDAGTDNIRQAGGLSSKAMRDAYEEAAKRAIELADANLEEAKEQKKRAEKFALAVREHGEAMAAELEGGFKRASTLATLMGRGEGLMTGRE